MSAYLWSQKIKLVAALFSTYSLHLFRNILKTSHDTVFLSAETAGRKSGENWDQAGGGIWHSRPYLFTADNKADHSVSCCLKLDIHSCQYIILEKLVIKGQLEAYTQKLE